MWLSALRIIALVLTFTAFTSSAASVFKIENGEHTLYLAGTFHLLQKQDYPLPSAFKQAYQASDEVVFETNVSALSSPELQQKSLSMLTYTDGTTLDDILSPETLTQLKTYLASRQVPYDLFKVMKPGLAATSLSIIELTALGLTHPGVDMYYNTLAIGDGKAISWFEEPEEQLSFIAKMGLDKGDEYIQYTLNDLANLPSALKELKQAWREGNLADLERTGISEWANQYPDVYALILADRNDKWMIKIHQLLKSEAVEFVLVGALHLAGEDGLIKQLRNAGYSVSQLN